MSSFTHSDSLTQHDLAFVKGLLESGKRGIIFCPTRLEHMVQEGYLPIPLSHGHHGC